MLDDMLFVVVWYLLTDVSEQHICFTFEGQAVQEEFFLHYQLTRKKKNSSTAKTSLPPQRKLEFSHHVRRFETYVKHHSQPMNGYLTMV
jgi:hypothetical protein